MFTGLSQTAREDFFVYKIHYVENAEEKNQLWSVSSLSEIERRNLLGFFALLHKIDKRVNPHLYKNASNRSPNNADQGK